MLKKFVRRWRSFLHKCRSIFVITYFWNLTNERLFSKNKINYKIENPNSFSTQKERELNQKSSNPWKPDSDFTAQHISENNNFLLPMHKTFSNKLTLLYQTNDRTKTIDMYYGQFLQIQILLCINLLLHDFMIILKLFSKVHHPKILLIFAWFSAFWRKNRKKNEQELLDSNCNISTLGWIL